MNFLRGQFLTKLRCELCLFSQGKTPEFTNKGEIHELILSQVQERHAKKFSIKNFGYFEGKEAPNRKNSRGQESLGGGGGSGRPGF